MIFDIFVLGMLLVLSGIFSGVETALTSVSLIKAKALAKQGKFGAKSLLRLKLRPHRMIITVLIGNNLVNIGAAAYATVVFIELFGNSGVGIATGVMTFLILVFGEITPKTFAVQNSVAISLIASKPIEYLSILLYPFVVLFGLISQFVTRTFSTKTGKKLSEEEIRSIVIVGRKEGILSKDIAEMMENVLEFEGRRVSSIMIPSSKVSMIDGNKKLNDVLDELIESPYTRFPVYEKDRSNIVGILNVDDLLIHVKNRKTNLEVKDYARKAYFVPASREIDDLLVDFEKTKRHLAIVVSELGDFLGIVSIVDIMEEIVGDIFDKSISNDKLRKLRASSLVIDAQTPFDNLVRAYNLDEDYEGSVAGYIIEELKRIPKKGEKIRVGSVTIEVNEVDNKKIESVRIIR
jgi:putative hemolysin